jgi:hypothetical protein
MNRDHEELQDIQDGAIAHTALGFSRQIAADRVNTILQKAFAMYRDETLTAERALTMIAQMVGLDDLRLALEQRVTRGLVSAERREGNAKRR